MQKTFRLGVMIFFGLSVCTVRAGQAPSHHDFKDAAPEIKTEEHAKAPKEVSDLLEKGKGDAPEAYGQPGVAQKGKELSVLFAGFMFCAIEGLRQRNVDPLLAAVTSRDGLES